MADKQAKIIDERLATKADLEAFRIAAKADLEALRIATKADLEALRIGTKADMAEQKAEILKWIMGTIGIQTVVIIGAVLALVRVVQH
jgi:predicted TIM-barrel enzyme